MERVTYTVAFISGAPNPSTMPVQTAGQKSRLNAVINKAHSLWEKSSHKEQKPTGKRVALWYVILEVEWHTIDNADFDGVEHDILEITEGPGTPEFENIEPTWTDAKTWQMQIDFFFFFFVR